MKRERFYITDIRADLIEKYKDNKAQLNVFGRFFDSKKKAEAFLQENPNPDIRIYTAITEGRKMISLK